MMKRQSKFLSILALFLSLAMAVQGPAMAQVVVSVSLPITIIARLTTHPDFYNTRLPLQLVSPVVSDLDNDGVLEVIGAGYNETTRRSSVFVWHRNGTVNPGWPVEIDGRIENLPVVGDLDNDGDLEISVGVRRNTAEPGGWIYIWHHDGTPYVGSPSELAYIPSVPVVGDVSGDFAEEVYYQPNSIGLVICDIDLDGKKELIMAQNAGLGVYEIAGGELTVIPGLAIDLPGAISVGTPIVGDADGNGLPEIFLAVRQADGNYIYIYEWNDDRTALISRSINAAGVVNTPGNFLSLADINGDGIAEILTGSTNGWVAGWYLDGRVAFSQFVPNIGDSDGEGEDGGEEAPAVYQPIVGDIDNDGDMEILASSSWASIYCLDHNGNPVDGWPRLFNYTVSPGLVLVDLDSDTSGDAVNPTGDLELLFGTYDGRVCIIDLAGNFNPNNIQWGMYGFNPRDTGNYTRDWNTAEWSIFDNDPAVAEIESVYDWNRGGRVVELSGDGINNIYRFSRPEARPLNSKNTTLQWAMRFNEPFNIYVSVDTVQGRRYLRYTATEGNEPPEGNIIHHGLGGDADNGMWHTFSRSLVQDLHDAQPINEIVDINAVYVQGSGRIDDIMLLRGLPTVDLVNLALIADTVAVSSGNGRYINDGDPETIWTSDGEDDPWVEYTWNEPQRVNKIVIEAPEGATTVDILITDSNGNTQRIENYVIPPDGVIPFNDTIDNVSSIRVIFKDSAGPVSVGEIGVYYDSNLDSGGGGGGDTGGQTYPSSNYIRIDVNGYFFNPVTNTPWIPRGIAYQTSDPYTGTQRSLAEVRSDLETIAGIGVDAIRVDFVWGQIETEDNDYEDGFRYYDTLLEVAKDKGIKVFPIIGWQYPPSWAPDDWYSAYSDDSRANLISFEDTDVQRELEQFIQAVVRRYSEGGARQDLGDTIAAWILGNGFSYLDPVSLRYIGYDPDSREAFSGGEEYDLIEWREQSIARFIALAAAAVREVDTAHLITYASVGLQYGEEDWGYSSEDAKKIKEACDTAGVPLSFWSINNYPWAQENSELITGQWPIEKARRDTGLPIMITETGFTTTDGIIEISEARQARLVRNAIWEALESGAIGVCVYHWNDRDIPGREGGFGIVNIDGTPKPAYSAVQDVFTKMRELNIANYLINSRAPTPDIAFLWDDAVDTTINRYKAEMGTLFGTLERLGYEPSFVDDLTSLDGSYRAIVLPRTQRMFESTFELLSSVGVNIHADSDIPGLMDEYGIRQDDRVPIINELFGIDADEIRPPALVFWNGRAISINDPDINTWTWSDRYDLVKSIYTDESGFNIQPQLNVSNKHILADYRVTSDGSLLLSLRNYRADRAETTTVKSDLIQNKTVSDIFTSALIEENSDGEIVRTLEPDGHELLLARAGGGDTGSGTGTGDGSGGGSGSGSGDGSSGGSSGSSDGSSGSGSSTGGTSSTSSKSTTTTSQPALQLPTTTTTATTSAGEEDAVAVAAKNYVWGPATVVVLEEEDKKKKTQKDSVGSVETIQAKAQPRSGVRTYTGSEYRYTGGSAAPEPVYPEVPAIPPIQQFQYAIEERRDADVGAVRARPQIVSPAQLEKIIKPPEIEFQKSAPAYDIADSINKWISDLKDLWKNLVKRAQVAYNSISRTYA